MKELRMKRNQVLRITETLVAVYIENFEVKISILKEGELFTAEGVVYLLNQEDVKKQITEIQKHQEDEEKADEWFMGLDESFKYRFRVQNIYTYADWKEWMNAINESQNKGGLYA